MVLAAFTSLAEAQTAGTAPVPANETTASPEAAEAPDEYVDELIDAGELGEEDAGQGADEPEDTRVGRRFASLEHRYFLQDRSGVGSSSEYGLVARWSRETVAYGLLSMDVQLRVPFGADSSEDRTGSLLSLRQDGYALGAVWQADTELGDLRATTDRLASNSFRFSLPSSIARGFQTHLYSEDTELRVAAAKVGSLEGTRTLTFDDSDGWLGGLGYTRTLSQRWNLGVQGWWLRGNDTVRDHQSVTGVLEFDDPDNRDAYQLHSLYDSTGNFAVWFDGDNTFGRWRHRYGIFRFDPELLWTDVEIINDRQGFYWRADRRSSRRSWSTGIELEESNIDSRSDRAGVVFGNAFANVNWRLRLGTNVGGSVQAALQRPGSGLDSDRIDSYRVTGFWSEDTDLGLSRFQVVAGETREDGDPSTDYQLSWDQDWAVPRGNRLTTSLAWERFSDAVNEGDANDSSQLALGVSYGRDISSDHRIFADASTVRASGNGSDSVNANLGAFWRPVRNWQIDLTASWNRSEAQGSNGSSETDRRVFFTLRWAEAGGNPIVSLGRDTGKGGAGSVRGRVFLDENRDGRWSPNEEAVAGLAVYLDGAYTRRTDEDGRFEFTPVFSGEHEVFIALEDVPLPWGLEDETPLRVEVPVRDEVEVDFALISLDE